MKTLSYTITKHNPVYAWKNQAQTVIFELHLEPLINLFKQNVADHHKHFSNIPKTWPRYQAHLDTLQLIEWLAQQRNGNQQSVSWDARQHELIRYYARDLVYSGQFESVFCSTCDATYSSQEGAIENWEVDEGLFVEGGKRCLCPNGHVLYAMVDWTHRYQQRANN